MDKFGKILLQFDEVGVSVIEVLLRILLLEFFTVKLFEFHSAIECSDLVLVIKLANTGNRNVVKKFKTWLVDIALPKLVELRRVLFHHFRLVTSQQVLEVCSVEDTGPQNF